MIKLGKLSRRPELLLMVGALGVGAYFLVGSAWKGGGMAVNFIASSATNRLTPVFGGANNNPQHRNSKSMSGLPADALRWEVYYDIWGTWDCFRGPKVWPAAYGPIVGPAQAALAGLPPPTGKITFSGSMNSSNGRMRGGKLVPRDYWLQYNGQRQASIVGDARALYCLDLLCSTGGLTRLDHLGILPGKTYPGVRYGHEEGYAIDLTNNDQMNLIIEAAKRLDMPICWISRHKSAQGWPVFMLKYRQKVLVGHSKVNHDSHYHVMLPRPSGAVPYFNR